MQPASIKQPTWSWQSQIVHLGVTISGAMSIPAIAILRRLSQRALRVHLTLIRMSHVEVRTRLRQLWWEAQSLLIVQLAKVDVRAVIRYLAAAITG